MGSQKAKKNRPLTDRFIRLYEQGQRFVVFDVETVGYPPVIVEIGAIEAGRNYVNQYRTFQKILRFRPLSWRPYMGELHIHHIPIDEIENGEDRITVFAKFIEFISNATLICHTNFDIRASLGNIRHHPELLTALELNEWNEFIDSCRLAREMCPHLKSFALSKLAQVFQIVNPQSHRALSDAYTTKKMIGHLLQYHYCHNQNEI